MSTRGIVAVQAEGAWSGFEIKADAYPDGAGVKVLKLLAELGLEEFCQRTVQARLFSGMRERASAATHGDRGDLSWVYLVRPATRTLEVWCQGMLEETPGGLGLSGRWGEVGRHHIGADGTVTPPKMQVVLPAPWPFFRVGAAWEESEFKHGRSRLETRRRVDRECASSGLSVQAFLDLVSHAICETLFSAPWTGRRSPSPMSRVYVPFLWSPTEDVNWSVRLAGLEIFYPPPARRWNLVRTDIEGGESLEFWTADDATAVVDVRRSEIVKVLGDRAEPIFNLLITALASDWIFAFFDLVRATQIEDRQGDQAEAAATEAVDREHGRLPWRVFRHPDGRVWAIRPVAAGYQLRLGEPADDPVLKDRPTKTPDAEIARLISEQLADGFVQQPDEAP
jgi:hypothetical protein